MDRRHDNTYSDKTGNFFAERKLCFLSCFKTLYVAAAKTCPCKTSYLPRMCAAALLHSVAVAAKPRIMYCFWYYHFCTVITNAFTAHMSKSKPEIEFQYVGSPFSKTGSSFISATDWDISSKFGMQIDYGLPKQIPSLNLNPEVVFRLYGRHLDKSILRHNSAADTIQYNTIQYNIRLLWDDRTQLNTW